MARAPEGSSSVFWHKDACGQPTCMCGRSSIEVLLSWLAVTTPAGNINFVRWKGGLRTKDGVNKKTVAKEISDLLMTRHRLVRNVASIMAKLSELQTTFNAARDFLNHTGSGVQEDLAR